jgi:hypothetical protein
VSQAAARSPDEQLFLGRYRAIRQLGSGGSGRVWLARDELKGREVALKIVPREGKAGSRARREAQAMARLDHEHCLHVFACGRDTESVYIAYEFVAGQTFREALRAGRITDAGAVETATQVLDALAHVHAHDIVHRDVKPANVLLADGDGRISVRLLDFGLARVAEADTLTASGDVPGTLAYIAPERLRGAPADAAADVWSVGVLLYEALAGRHPFWRPSLAETADAIMEGAPPIRTERPDLPEPLQAVVDRALTLDPARRPSAAKLAKLLRRARGERPPRLPAVAGELETRVAPVVLSGIYAAAGAWILPFYPAHAALLLAVLAGAATAIDARIGLALALAAPIFPLGNVALALSLVYAAVALVWFVVFLGEPERGLLPALGPLLGPLAPVVLPVAFVTTRAWYRRAFGAAAGVVLAAAVAAARAGPGRPDVIASRHPIAVASTLIRAAPHALVFEVPLAAAAAIALPFIVRRVRQFGAGRGRIRTYTR